MAEHEADFTVLGQVDENKLKKAVRVLPKWLANPSIINTDLKNLASIDEIKDLDKRLLTVLKENKITHFFPVQSNVIPWLLQSISQKCLPPRDLCVSAPTGSGKTLAFVLPMLQALKHRRDVNVKALVLLPVKDLAIQVFRVFESYSKGTRIKVGLVGGEMTFPKEQTMLVRKDKYGLHSNVDIVVATPGRLVDHIVKTSGFSLEHLIFLVIDEADRIFEETNKDCLKIIEEKILEKCDKSIKNFTLDLPGIPKVSSMHEVLCTGVFTPASCHWLRSRPQKWLFSATLSQDPEKLQRMNLYQPKLFTSIIQNKLNLVENNSDKYVGKYTTPAILKERFIACDLSTKPLMLYYLLDKLKFKRVLCFTNTRDTMQRLYLLMKKMCFPRIKVEQFSANSPVVLREKILKTFSAGKIDLLISSDMASRGIDFVNVDCVISYELPKVLKNYIHRIGRTARAGRKGTAISFLQKKEVTSFKNLLKAAGKTHIKEYVIEDSELQTYEEQFKSALAHAMVCLKNKRN